MRTRAIPATGHGRSKTDHEHEPSQWLEMSMQTGGGEGSSISRSSSSRTSSGNNNNGNNNCCADGPGLVQLSSSLLRLGATKLLLAPRVHTLKQACDQTESDSRLAAGLHDRLINQTSTYDENPNSNKPRTRSKQHKATIRTTSAP
jgi:hypothetical protein